MEVWLTVLSTANNWVLIATAIGTIIVLMIFKPMLFVWTSLQKIFNNKKLRSFLEPLLLCQLSWHQAFILGCCCEIYINCVGLFWCFTKHRTPKFVHHIVVLHTLSNTYNTAECRRCERKFAFYRRQVCLCVHCDA